jgi:hypothetical protein
MKIRHAILRSYTALARGEFYGPSEIGETLDFVGVYRGRLIGSYPLRQLNWTEDAEAKETFCSARNISPECYDAKLIFPKPSVVKNLVYSAKLREVYGAERLRLLPEFNADGIFILNKQRGFYIPERRGAEIVGLRFEPAKAEAKRK